MSNSALLKSTTQSLDDIGGDIPNINAPGHLDVPNIDVPDINMPNINPGHVGLPGRRRLRLHDARTLRP